MRGRNFGTNRRLDEDGNEELGRPIKGEADGCEEREGEGERLVEGGGDEVT